MMSRLLGLGNQNCLVWTPSTQHVNDHYKGGHPSHRAIATVKKGTRLDPSGLAQRNRPSKLLRK